MGFTPWKVCRISALFDLKMVSDIALDYGGQLFNLDTPKF